MNSFHLLVIFIVPILATNNTINEFCEDQCKDVCVPCQEPVRCTEDQTDCGLGPVDPAFGGVCPPHSICVAKNLNCPCYNENGDPYPSTTIVDCEEDELLCTGGSPGNGCPGQDVCIPRGVNNKGDLCEGFCPIDCKVDEIKCSQISPDGCTMPTLCIPKSTDNNRKICVDQQCPCHCSETEFFCSGDINELGCKSSDTCVAKGISSSGELCPGICPVECDPVTEKHCVGPLDKTGCKGPDACHAKARNLNGEYCQDNSDSHGCPIICSDDTMLCPTKMDILGCKEQPKCVPITKDTNDDDCPLESICPTICEPSEVSCPGGNDENGCKKPGICVGQNRDYNGDLCPVHCPGICGDNEVLCDGQKEAMGCKMPAMCLPRGTKTKGSDIGGLCPGNCPTSCKHNEVLCASQVDCDGCSTEEMCRPKAKDSNGLHCSEDSASHDCPVECDETIGEVLCPTYDSTTGCKPKALCLPRPADVKGEYCPAHSACSKECQWNEILCMDGADSRGCKNAELCLARGEDKDGNLCPGICPPICSNSEYFCPGPIFNNGCRGPGLCIENMPDVNGIECPEACPVFCSENEHMVHGGIDARGCMAQDRCLAKCVGGDSCCSAANKCDVGEGDCDSDADCLDGLLCGTGHCPTTRSAFWDVDDDCCYKPANSTKSCIELGYHYIGDTKTVDKVDGIESAEKCQQLCNGDDRCNWFAWRDATNPTGCWLLTNKGSTKDDDLGRHQGATGPKSCSVSGCNVNGSVGDGTQQGTCDRGQFCYTDGTCKEEPEPSAEGTYTCENKGCKWSDYEKQKDWAYYSETNGNCSECKDRCNNDNDCGAIECGKGYCSWWKVGKCITTKEFTISAYTCLKEGESQPAPQ